MKMTYLTVGKMGMAKLMGLPIDITTEPTENTEKSSKKPLWTPCSLW
jgi:hypothetical protein